MRNQRQTALELAEIYETRDKDIQLVENIRGNNLFLLPDFTREALCQMLNINKAKCTSAIKTYANTSFPSYINRLRLNHAIDIMKRHPEYSIESIANQCGMQRANFYRRFIEEFGITPYEFKQTKL